MKGAEKEREKGREQMEQIPPREQNIYIYVYLISSKKGEYTIPSKQEQKATNKNSFLGEGALGNEK